MLQYQHCNCISYSMRKWAFYANSERTNKLVELVTVLRQFRSAARKWPFDTRIFKTPKLVFYMLM